MGVSSVFIDSFTLLRERPLLFLPKLISSVIWSGFWLLLGDLLTEPAAITGGQLQVILLFILIVFPAQIWLFISYFIIVRQYHHGEVDMTQAFQDGLPQLPRGIAAFFLPVLISTVLSLPGAAVLAYGVSTGSIVLQGLGALLIAAVFLGTGILFYFSPVTVVLGDGGFLEEFRRGIHASRENNRIVTGITVLSFALLGLAFLLEGWLEQLGAAGFITGRLVGSVINLYILLVNPGLLLSLEE